ncbi:MaoC family dehydratase [Agrobacterium sp. LMR679]|uniref:MaoC family dehydratase n=1 Tax=Agrobacterium sp. LMR679 TaxID=3014335 RepID=UPI0022AF0F02|nr:MaoC/PaaZ C-terminal domain-containing protein [Agrobacterium sp. LMR679]MCZ4072132.1 MaoC/PaaZ C-terminal domain-containing protein [Agrobacterium sp. LMR679]
MNLSAPIENMNELTMPLSVGQNFSRSVAFSADSIKQFAVMAGDPNPLHHDDEIAKASRFGRLIAAGTQTTTMLAGAVAWNLCRLKPSLGLEMSFKFRRAILVDEVLKAKWQITEIKHNCHLGGDIVTIDCELRNEHNFLLVQGTVVSLVID